jgi:hypothetical protein
MAVDHSSLPNFGPRRFHATLFACAVVAGVAVAGVAGEPRSFPRGDRPTRWPRPRCLPRRCRGHHRGRRLALVDGAPLHPPAPTRGDALDAPPRADDSAITCPAVSRALSLAQPGSRACPPNPQNQGLWIGPRSPRIARATASVPQRRENRGIGRPRRFRGGSGVRPRTMCLHAESTEVGVGRAALRPSAAALGSSSKQLGALETQGMCAGAQGTARTADRGGRGSSFRRRAPRCRQ